MVGRKSVVIMEHFPSKHQTLMIQGDGLLGSHHLLDICDSSSRADIYRNDLASDSLDKDPDGGRRGDITSRDHGSRAVITTTTATNTAAVS